MIIYDCQEVIRMVKVLKALTKKLADARKAKRLAIRKERNHQRFLNILEQTKEI